MKTVEAIRERQEGMLNMEVNGGDDVDDVVVDKPSRREAESGGSFNPSTVLLGHGRPVFTST